MSRRRLRAICERLETVGHERDAGATRRNELAGLVAACEARGAELAGALRDIDARAAATLAEIADADAAIVTIRERRTGLVSRLNVLEEMERRFEGVDRGARAVLSWRDESGAGGTVAGLVADCLRIDDPRVWHESRTALV